MKLVIRETCVAAGGVIVERGQLYSTQEVDPKRDQEAFALISANRAVKAGTPEAAALLDEIAAEKREKAAATPPPPPSKK